MEDFPIKLKNSAIRYLGLLLVVVCFSQSYADDGLRRIPVATDYSYIGENQSLLVSMCTALLTPPPEPNTCNLALLSVTEPASTSNSELNIVASLFSRPEGTMYQAIPEPAGYEIISIDKAKLADTDNSAIYTEETLKRIANHMALSEDATLVVDPASNIDTSLLLKHAKKGQFIIEQHSEPERFHLNLLRMRQRAPSSPDSLSVFDFSPRSSEAMREFGVGGTEREWLEFSQKIRTTFANSDAVKSRSLDALRRRLLDPSGGVVVIYGHSDGEKIFVDTDSGLQTLTVAEIEEIGLASGQGLPPIYLLNCEAQNTIAPAFLRAGSPFVAATDKPMTLTDATRFLDSLAQSIFGDGLDVIDALYEAGEKIPYRMRPMANSSLKLMYEQSNVRAIHVATDDTGFLNIWFKVSDRES